MFVFFFSSRRRHTRSKRDWSSDVCSSDLPVEVAVAELHGLLQLGERGGLPFREREAAREVVVGRCVARLQAHRSEERRVGKEGRARWAGEGCMNKRGRTGTIVTHVSRAIV